MGDLESIYLYLHEYKDIMEHYEQQYILFNHSLWHTLNIMENIKDHILRSHDLLPQLYAFYMHFFSMHIFVRYLCRHFFKIKNMFASIQTIKYSILADYAFLFENKFKLNLFKICTFVIFCF